MLSLPGHTDSDTTVLLLLKNNLRHKPAKVDHISVCFQETATQPDQTEGGFHGCCRKWEIPKVPPPESLPGLLHSIGCTFCIEASKHSGDSWYPQLLLHPADSFVPSVDFFIRIQPAGLWDSQGEHRCSCSTVSRCSCDTFLA